MRASVKANECVIECDVLELACLRALARRHQRLASGVKGGATPAVGIREVKRAMLAAILSFCDRGCRDPRRRRT